MWANWTRLQWHATKCEITGWDYNDTLLNVR
jgi:hypothetical protein